MKLLGLAMISACALCISFATSEANAKGSYKSSCSSGSSHKGCTYHNSSTRNKYRKKSSSYDYEHYDMPQG
jgi:hypothetical protein